MASLIVLIDLMKQIVSLTIIFMCNCWCFCFVSLESPIYLCNPQSFISTCDVPLINPRMDSNQIGLSGNVKLIIFQGIYKFYRIYRVLSVYINSVTFCFSAKIWTVQNMIVKILIFNSFQFIEHRLKATSGVEYIFIYIKFEHKLAMVPLEKMQLFNIEKESTFSTYTDIFAVMKFYQPLRLYHWKFPLS